MKLKIRKTMEHFNIKILLISLGIILQLPLAANEIRNQYNSINILKDRQIRIEKKLDLIIHQYIAVEKEKAQKAKELNEKIKFNKKRKL